MGARSKAEILAFYEDMKRYQGWGHLDALRSFLPLRFRERELTGCTFFTSHETLCIVRVPSYPEWFDGPMLSINCTDKDHLKFSFRVVQAFAPVVRTMTEDVVCRISQGLEEFDKLYAKLVAAHENRPH